jgi:hypothetical protein
MTRCKFKVAEVLVFILLGVCAAFGQRAHAGPDLSGSGRAQGSLTVTMTVVSSVGLVTGPDGQQRIVVANAVAASDNVSSLRYVRLTDVNSSNGSASQATGNALRKTPSGAKAPIVLRLNAGINACSTR